MNKLTLGKPSLLGCIMARTDLSKSLLSRYEKLEGQRQNWETHWQEVADYMQPRKADVTKTRARGDKRNGINF